MCGIVGAIAGRNVAQIMLEGLKRLEYRGYDSAGLAVIDPENSAIKRLRAMGKVKCLGDQLKQTPLVGNLGIAHTRWATHGKPSTSNAHPHCSEDQIAVVHNGIIENHDLLREKLKQEGYQFDTETDTEVIVHLIHLHAQRESDFIKVLRNACAELVGAYALGIINATTPDTLYAVRCGSPLVIGIGIEEYFIASDPLALSPVTQQFIYLEEGDIAALTTQSLSVYDSEGNPCSRHVLTTEMDSESVSKGKYRHFMQKEIFEQPQAILDTINGYIFDDNINIDSFGAQALEIFAKIKSIHIVACGTSYHAGVVARYWLESIAKVPTQIEVASEFRYRDAMISDDTLFVTLSQSGETADTLAALRLAKKLGVAATMGICNAPESSMAREADLLFLTRAGNEVGVAATKTFTTQLVALLLLTLCLQQIHSPNTVNDLAKTLTRLPNLVQQTLKLDQQIQQISHHFADKQHALFLGRGEHHPIALEGALKLKEISYLHAEAYPAGELKHGPLALVDKDMPVIVIAPNNNLVEKLESNIQEVQARQGDIYLFIDENLNWPHQQPNKVIKIPTTPEPLTPIIYTLPLQLLAYHIAVLKGTDVDQPRNLAKSVTVE